LREKEHLLATLHLLATHEKEGVSKVDKWTVNAISRQQIRSTERKVSCRQPEMATALRPPQKNSEEDPAAQGQKLKQR